MSWVCEACSKTIFGTSSDPLISTKGLGWKNYHYACAQAVWGSRRPDSVGIAGLHERNSKDPGKAGVEETMKMAVSPEASRGKFLVQCDFTHNGLRLSDFVNSLEEAEEYFNRQVRACPAAGGIDCAVLLVLKNGKKTRVDGHAFGAAILQNSDGSEEDEIE